MDRMEIPDGCAVSVYEVGILRRKEMRALIASLSGANSLSSVEVRSLCSSTFVIIGKAPAMLAINDLMQVTMPDRPVLRKAELITIAALTAVAVVGWAVASFAGDLQGDVGGIGGLTSRTEQQQQTNQTGQRTWFGETYYGPDIFSWEYLSNPFTNVGPGTPYDGGPDGGDVGGSDDGGWGSSMDGRGA